ncbi:inovirus Gp2 family protein [Yersinia intermedia]|uniref:inovirus Gp2 family protein n=1 Tax=Yersinia intermedia TaxID=631 RepID=UPI0022FDE9FC|nr:inovirus Gp2 family protein [Yersinia intermedia]MDA5510809.1 inovirus Gp2 family protein [Yersinia intermedia]
MSINNGSYGSLNKHYVNRIQETINKSVSEYPRTMLLRIDLRLPDTNVGSYNGDSTLVTRFIASLKSQVEAYFLKKQSEGKRVHRCHIRHIWAREFNQDGKKHYHLALLFNKDAYAYPGSYTPEDGEYTHNLAVMVMEAWVRTLNLHGSEYYQQYYSLVEFPENCYYHLNANSADFSTQFTAVVDRVNYLAKEFSKVHSDGQRNFGCSQY